MSEPFATEASKFARERTGLIRISPTYIIPGPTEDGGTEPYELLEKWKPDRAPLGLPEVERNAVKQTDGSWALTIDFEGVTSDDALNPQLEFDNASVEDPIETHADFDKLKAKYNARIVTGDNDEEEFKGFAYKVKDPVTGQKVKNPFFGVTHFLNNNPILRVEFGLKNFRPELIRDICKIGTPQVPSAAKDVIETPDGKSWLKRSVKASFRGNVWLIVIEWALGKWSVDVYGPKAG